MKKNNPDTALRKGNNNSKKRKKPSLPGHLPPKLTIDQLRKLSQDKRARIIYGRKTHTNPLWKTKSKTDTGEKTTSPQGSPKWPVMFQNSPPISPTQDIGVRQRSGAVVSKFQPPPPPTEVLRQQMRKPPAPPRHTGSRIRLPVRPLNGVRVMLQAPSAPGVDVQTSPRRPHSDAVASKFPPPLSEALRQQMRKPPAPSRHTGSRIQLPGYSHSTCKDILFARRDKQDGRQASDVHAVGQGNLTTPSQFIKDQHVTNWRR